MVDGITGTCILPLAEGLITNPHLAFKRQVLEQSGERSSYCTAEYLGLHFTLFDSGFLKIQGSLHRFFNDGGPNDTLFTFADTHQAIRHLCQMVGVYPHDISLQKLEIGVNIPTGDIPAAKIIEAAVAFNKKPFNIEYSANQAVYKEAVFSDFSVKVYEKDIYLLRFEVASNRSRYFSKFQIETLEDLLNLEKFESIFQFLYSSLDHVFFFDLSWGKYFPDSQALAFFSPKKWISLEYHKRQNAINYIKNRLNENQERYWGVFLMERMLELWPMLVEEIPAENKELFEFSTLGSPWNFRKNEPKNKNGGPGHQEIKISIFLRGIFKKGHLGDFPKEYGLAWVSRDQARTRSPPLLLSFHQLQQ